jgi:hypothetical protein
MPAAKVLCLLTSIFSGYAAAAQESPFSLLGRWEVLRYDEQGVPVDKKAPAAAQAARVYAHAAPGRARQFYGYDADYESLQGRRAGQFAEWLAADSLRETRRIETAIGTPYFAVFFADSTLALYNKDSLSGLVAHAESWKYAYDAPSRSLDLWPSRYERWDAQVLALTAERLLLFLPQAAERVELRRAPGELP